MKGHISKGIILMLFVVGLGLLCYPTISNWYGRSHQIDAIDAYKEQVEQANHSQLDRLREEASQYNEGLFGNAIITDPFSTSEVVKENRKYNELLNLSQDGIMGYVQIPSIEVYLPIYHGTEEDVLKKGAGHLMNSSLPIGGEGSHTVITGHTGLPFATLFTNLDQVEEGDYFFLYVLEERLVYQVDQIKVVEPENTEDLVIEQKKDYATLVTCTPYGVNSHRLLVRGVRVVDWEKEEAASVVVDEKQEGVLTEGLWNLLLPGCLLVVVIVVVMKYSKNTKRRDVHEEKSRNDN